MGFCFREEKAIIKKKVLGRSDYYILHYCLLFSVTFPLTSATAESTVPT